jgi:hypothetical protein
MWISGFVLVIGVAVFLAVFLGRGSSPAATGISTISSGPKPTDTTQSSGAKVPAAPAALAVARTFLETAVPRKNLDTAYDLVGPALKGGFSRAAWRTGNIPVQYFDATNLKTAQFLIKWSHPSELMLEVGLKGKPGSNVKSLAFLLGVDRIGGKWLVNYFIPEAPNGHPITPYGN